MTEDLQKKPEEKIQKKPEEKIQGERAPEGARIGENRKRTFANEKLNTGKMMRG